MPTAELVYHAYGMMEDPDNTGRSIYDVANMLKRHMRYSSSAYVAYRFDYSRQEFIDLLKAELDAGRPLLIESWSSTSTPPGQNGMHEGHYWNIDGYDEQDRFHVVWNNGNYTTWIDIHSMTHPDFDAYYIWALINAMPDESGKLFAFNFPSEGHMFKINEEVNLTWEQRNVESINIDIKYGQDEWITIGENIQTNTGSWNWVGPDRSCKNVSLRVRDADNENYFFHFDGFESYEHKMLNIVTPISGDKYENGAKVCLAWEYEGINELQFEVKKSGSDDWQMVGRSLNAKDRFLIWPLPMGSGVSYDFQLSSADGAFVELVENVLVGIDQEVGGPYTKDFHSLLLMHCDNNFTEECNGIEVIKEGKEVGFDYSVGGKGAALHLDNSERTNMSYIEIPGGDDFSLRGSFTIDLWFKINSWDNITTNKPLIIGKPASGTRVNYSLTGNANKGTVIFKSRTTAGDVKVECKEGIIVPGVWYHAAIIHEVETREIRLLLHNERKERIDEQMGSYPEGAGIMVGSSNLLIGKKEVGTTYLDGCVDEIRISRIVRDFNAVWSGVGEQVTENEILIYPNPASGLIHVELPDRLQVSGFSLHDILGKVVKVGSLDRVGTVNVSELPAGLYCLVIDTEAGRISERVLVE